MFSSRRLSATTQPGAGSASSGRRAGGRMRAGRWSIVTRHLDHIHLISFIVAEPNINWLDYEVTLSSSPDQVHSSSQGARVWGPGELHLPASAGGVQVSLKSQGWSLAVTLCSRSATTRLFMGTEAGAQGIMNLTNCVTILVSFIHMCCYVCLVFFYV